MRSRNSSTSSSSPCPVDELKRNVLHHADHYAPREFENVYFCDEEEWEDSDVSDSDGPSVKAPPTSDGSRQFCNLFPQFRSSKLIYFVILLSIAVLIVPLKSPLVYLISHELYTPTPPTLSLHAFTKQLAADFPNQTNRFWATVRAALEQTYRRHFEKPNSDFSANTLFSTVLLLVNGHGDRKSANSTFDCFVSLFGHSVTRFLFHSPSPDCAKIKPIPLSAGDSAMDLDSRVRRLHSQGVRCFHFPSIDLYPSEVIPLFHGLLNENHPVVESILLFSLNEMFAQNDGSDIRSPGHVQSFAQLEHQIQRYLRKLWSPSLGFEETDAILSRLTRNIAIFTDLGTSIHCK